MCGILGYWNGKGIKLEDNIIFKALSSLKHRGPNGQGCSTFSVENNTLVLGHTRLSIIDLSDSGHQPMATPDGRYSLVFNGEIYNYRELKVELSRLGYSFTSDTDTEVLLFSWVEWGYECLKNLVGMFAFVVYERDTNYIHCVRDAFGIKPFFYSFQDGHFFFASELSAISILSLNEPSLNMQRVYDYLVHGDYDSNTQCFLNGIYHLSPASSVSLNLNTGTLSAPNCWWVPNIEKKSSIGFKDAAKAVREQFLQDIRFHLRSDVPLGATLSGGLDSSAIVCAMRYVEPDLPIHTFSFIAEGSSLSEEYWVNRINSYVDAIPHKVYVNGNGLSNDLDDLVDCQGEPFGSTSIYASFRVLKLAHENGITVTLDGQGADELLAGYSGYAGQRFHSFIDAGEYIAAFKFINSWSKWPNRSLYGGAKRIVNEFTYNSEFIQRVLKNINGEKTKPDWLNINVLKRSGVNFKYPQNRDISGKDGRRVVAELYSTIKNKGLASLLRHGDRNSMRFSIESRVPFLTIPMAELLYSLPEEYLISKHGETKSVFREAMKGIVPDDVLSRKDKIGFVTPEKDWLNEERAIVREWLTESADISFLHTNKILLEFDRIVNDEKPFSWQVWRWINFIKWYYTIERSKCSRVYAKAHDT